MSGEEEAPPAAARAARFTTFATLGILGVTQELAGRCMESLEGADPELIAEETLCLVATATARAAEVGLRDEQEVAAAAANALMDVPFIYRDYLIGSAMVAGGDPQLAETGDAVYLRLQRKREFYSVHLPPDRFPGEKALGEKMALWMGRISPPRLPEMPQKRLEKLELVPRLVTHLKLVLAYGRK